MSRAWEREKSSKAEFGSNSEEFANFSGAISDFLHQIPIAKETEHASERMPMDFPQDRLGIGLFSCFFIF